MLTGELAYKLKIPFTEGKRVKVYLGYSSGWSFGEKQSHIGRAKALHDNPRSPAEGPLHWNLAAHVGVHGGSLYDATLGDSVETVFGSKAHEGILELLDRVDIMIIQNDHRSHAQQYIFDHVGLPEEKNPFTLTTDDYTKDPLGLLRGEYAPTVRIRGGKSNRTSLHISPFSAMLEFRY